MLIISYDISDTKVRSKFSQYIRKFGRRIQYSVYEIANSQRLLGTIQAEIETIFKPKFGQSDSVLIIPISPADERKIIRYGYPVNEETDFLLVE